MQAVHNSLRVALPKDALRIRQILMHSAVRDTFFHDTDPNHLGQVSRIKESMKNATWLVWEGGIFLVVPINKTVAEVHIAVLPEWRGKEALSACDTAAHFIFTKTHLTLLIGSTPADHMPARAFLSAVGFNQLRIENNRVISSLSFFDWMMTRDNPQQAFATCGEHGMTEKAAFARQTHNWITRKELAHGS